MNVSPINVALNRCINPDIRCQRKVGSVWSPNVATKRPPTAFKNSNAKEWMAPWVSNASGWKTQVAGTGRSAFLEIFCVFVCRGFSCSTLPAERVIGEHTSQLVCWLSSHLKSASGHLPSVLVRPHCSSVTGIPAAVRDRRCYSIMDASFSAIECVSAFQGHPSSLILVPI